MPDELVAIGVRLARAAEARGVPMRLIGGVAVAARTSGELPPWLRRSYGDIDMFVPRAAAKQAANLLREEGLEPDAHFNALGSGERQRWLLDPGAGDPHVDVFIGRFRMCHELELEHRVEVEPLTLPAADLLASKLQIVELNAKDVIDVAALLAIHTPAEVDGPERLSLPRLVELTRSDWGLFTTLTENLVALNGHLDRLEGETRSSVLERAERLHAELRDAPKTRRWRLRARVGRAKRWYSLPEEDL